MSSRLVLSFISLSTKSHQPQFYLLSHEFHVLFPPSIKLSHVVSPWHPLTIYSSGFFVISVIWKQVICLVSLTHVILLRSFPCVSPFDPTCCIILYTLNLTHIFVVLVLAFLYIRFSHHSKIFRLSFFLFILLQLLFPHIYNNTPPFASPRMPLPAWFIQFFIFDQVWSMLASSTSSMVTETKFITFPFFRFPFDFSILGYYSWRHLIAYKHQVLEFM